MFYLPNTTWRQVATVCNEVHFKAVGHVKVEFSNTEPSADAGIGISYNKELLKLNGGGLALWVRSAERGSASSDNMRSALYIDGDATFTTSDTLPTPVFIAGNLSTGADIVDVLANLNVGSTFSTSGGQVFSDVTSIQQFGPIDTIVSGTPVVQLSASIKDFKGAALEVTSGSGDEYHRKYAPRFVPDVQTTGDPLTSGSYANGGVYWQGALVTLPTGTGDAISLMKGSDSNLDAGIAYEIRAVKTDTGTVIELFYSNGTSVVSAGTSRELPNLFVEVFYKFNVSAGTLELQTKCEDETTWTTEFSLTGLTLVNHRDIYLTGYSMGTDTTVIEHHAFCVELDQGLPGHDSDLAKDIEWLWWKGSHVSSATQNAAKPVLICPPGMYRPGATARARLLNGPDAAWVTLPEGTSLSPTAFDLIGLAADTEYTLVFDISINNGGIYKTSPEFTFRTLPAIGTENQYSFWIGSCEYGSGAAKPNKLRETMLANVPNKFIHSEHLGDQGYESANLANLTEARLVCETTNDFDRNLREWADDRSQFAQMRAAVFGAKPDDHQVINGLDGRQHPGQSAAGDLVNLWPYRQATYSASITNGELVTAGYTAFDAWFPKLSYEAGDGELGIRKGYGLRRFGKTWYIELDTRGERLNNSQQHMSATQETWLRAQVTAFAASTDKLMILENQSVWGPVAANVGGESDGFTSVDWEGYKDLMDFINTTVPNTKSVILIGGDKHVGYTVSTLFRGQAGIIQGNDGSTPFLVDIVSSGVCAGFYYSGTENDRQVPSDGGLAYGSYILGYYDPQNSGGQPSANIIRTSGMLVSVDETLGTINLALWGRNPATKVLDLSLNFNDAAATVPDQVTNVVAVAGDTQVSLTWDVPNNNGEAITSYRVYRDTVLVGSPTTAAFVDTGLTNGTSYSYTVSAVNSVGEGPVSAVVSSTPVAVGAAWIPWEQLLGLVAAYSAHDATGYTDVSGAASQFTDRSGNSNHLLQSTAGARPTINAVNKQLEFDGIDDVMVSAASATGITTGTGEKTLVLCGRGVTTGNGHYAGITSTLQALAMNGQATGLAELTGRFNNGRAQPATLLSSTAGDFIFIMKYSTNHGSITFRTNGADNNPATANNPSSTVNIGTSNRLHIGANLDGGTLLPTTNEGFNVKSMMVLDNIPVSADVERIEGWIAHEFGLTGLLPAGHPYKSTAPST